MVHMYPKDGTPGTGWSRTHNIIIIDYELKAVGLCKGKVRQIPMGIEQVQNSII